MEYPNVSILTPSYNRSQFIPLIMYNLYNMDYDKTIADLKFKKNKYESKGKINIKNQNFEKMEVRKKKEQEEQEEKQK